MDQEFYWHIELYSGEIIKVKPDAAKVQYIQEMIAKQEGAITTPTRSIIIKDVKDFRLSDEIYNDQKLIEGAAQAFNDPKYTADGGIEARWVKRSVPRRRWESYYSKIPAYHALEENDSFVMIAFRLAVHTIDHTRVQELNASDAFRMAKIVNSVD